MMETIVWAAEGVWAGIMEIFTVITVIQPEPLDENGQEYVPPLRSH